MKQRFTLFLFTFYCANLFAFPWVPSEFLVEENGVQLKITCKQEVNPVANLDQFKKLDNFLDCNNQPIEGYCDCIAKKFDKKDPLTPELVRTLETEIGFFGRSGFSHLTAKVHEVTSNQQVLRIYGDDKNEACLDINKGGSHEIGYNKVLDSTKTAFDNIKKTGTKIPAYVNSKYLDEALANQASVLIGVDDNFENEINHDYNFLREVAKNIAKKDPQILLEGKAYRNKLKNFNDDGTPIDPDLHVQYEDNKALVPWQKSIKDSIIDGSQKTSSPLRTSVLRAFQGFGPYEKGNFTGDKQVFFEKMIEAVKKIGFTRDDLKELVKESGVINDAKFKKRLKDKDFKEAMKPFAKELCANTGNILLKDVRTNILGGAEMDSFNEGIYRTRGRRLMSDILNIDPKKVDGVKSLMKLSSIQNRLFAQMASQFDHMGDKSVKDNEEISKYILERKDQMGRLWCGANFVSSQIKEMNDHVTNNKEDSDRLISAKLSIRELEAQGKVVQTDLNSLGKEFYQTESSLLEMDKRIIETSNDMDKIALEIRGLGGSQSDRERKDELENIMTNKETLINSLSSTWVEEDNKLTNLFDVIQSKQRLANHISSAISTVTHQSVQNFNAKDVSNIGSKGADALATGSLAGSVGVYRQSKEVFSDYLIEGYSDQVEIIIEGEPAPDSLIGMPEQTFFQGVNEVELFIERRNEKYKTDFPGVTIFRDPLKGASTLSLNEAGDIVSSTILEEDIKVSEETIATLEAIEESAGLDIRDDISPELIESAKLTITRMANSASDNLEQSDAPEEVKLEHKKAISKFDDKMTNVLGEMNFTAKGEYDKPKRIREIIESSMGTNKKVRRMASLGKKPIHSDRTIPRVIPTSKPEIPESSSALAKVELPAPIIPASTLAATKPLKRKKFITSSVSTPKSIIGSKLEGLSGADFKAILSKKMSSRVKAKKPVVLKKKPAVVLVDPRIQKLRDEIERNKKLSKALDSDIAETVSESSLLKKKSEDQVAPRKNSRIVSSPVFSAPKNAVQLPKKSSSGSSSSRSPSSVKSFGGGSLSASGGGGNSAASSSVIEGRVSGGVVVNGEFIPSSLLARNIDIDGIKAISSESIVLGSKSSYEVKSSSDKSSSKGQPRVKSASFSSLSEDKKEEFIQKELIRLKADSLVIENSDGSEVVVKSKVKLRTRMKVANLNALFEKVDE